MRNQEIKQQNFMPEPEEREDRSGKSESSEGIVDHNPFNSIKDKPKVAPAQQKKIPPQKELP